MSKEENSTTPATNQDAEPLEEFSNEKVLSARWKRMTVLSALLAVITIGYLVVFNAEKDAYLAKWLAAIWFLGPPAWFAYENAHLLKPEDVERKPKRMARFRLGQDAAKMAWFGVAALIVYLTKFK
jgi:hypothetical protein